MNELEKQMKALANRRRLATILYIKQKGESTVGTIAEAIKLSFKATSKHLGILYAAGILERTQRSLTVSYRLSSTIHPTTKAVIKTLS